MPAADLSEQISTAGYEASGTGNMKFALNGALTIGTLDGANIEIQGRSRRRQHLHLRHDSRGSDGKEKGRLQLRANTTKRTRISSGSSTWSATASFSPWNKDLFQPIVESLLNIDTYLLFADFDAYASCQETVSKAYLDRESWTRKSIANVADMGKFSSDRSIQQYARQIWNVKPVAIELTEEEPLKLV